MEESAAPGRLRQVARAVGRNLGELRREAADLEPLPLVLLAGIVSLLVFLLLLVLSVELGELASYLLGAIFVFGIVAALAASVDQKPTRAKVWGEIGTSLLVAALIAFAVWFVDDQRRPVEKREALQATLSFQQDMPGVDLHGEDLDRFDLSGKNLEGANLSDAHLQDANLVRVNLRGAELAGADLSGANLEDADLSGADLTEADLDEAEGTLADLRGARLLRADLSEADLAGVNLKGACLAEGSLAGASLPGARLDRAALTGADLEGARFWFDLRRASLAAIGLDGAEHAMGARWPPEFEQRARKLATPDGLVAPAVVVAPARVTGWGKVLSVPDGDTLLLGTPKGRLDVRLIGIDAPELGDSGGGAARNALRQLLPKGLAVRFAYDSRRTDRLKRDLLYLFGPSGMLINQALLRRGVVVASIDPKGRGRGLRNVRYAGQLLAAEAWARQHARGLWETCPP